MGRMEVLKVVGGHLVSRPVVLERFLREIRCAARLHHPNIVTAYTALRFDESLVLAMEYAEGLDLARIVKAKGPLPVANACNYVHQAAPGLQHAHEHGMVHRDIKPANLILARAGTGLVKVLDFGLAKVTSEGQVDTGLTREGQMLGTPDYIAPSRSATRSRPTSAPTSTAWAARSTTSGRRAAVQGGQPLGPLPSHSPWRRDGSTSSVRRCRWSWRPWWPR